MRGGQPCEPQDFPAGGAGEVLDGRGLAAQQDMRQLLVGTVAGIQHADRCAAAQHRDPVGMRQQPAHGVSGQEEGKPAAGEAAQHPEQRAGLARGVFLGDVVQHDDAAILIHGLGEQHKMLLKGRERAAGRVGRQAVQADQLEVVAAHGVDLAVGDDERPPPAVRRDHEVFRDGQPGVEAHPGVQLVQARAVGRRLARKRGAPPAQKDRAALHGQAAHQHVHQLAHAGGAQAGQPQQFALVKRQVARAQRVHPGGRAHIVHAQDFTFQSASPFRAGRGMLTSTSVPTSGVL